MAKEYNKLPSEILRIKDEYSAFCFDEACNLIIKNLQDGKKAIFDEDYKKSNDDYYNFLKSLE